MNTLKKTVFVLLIGFGLSLPNQAFAGKRLSEYVNIFRGSNNDGGGYSRGNTVPLTCRPNGFSFWMAKTDTQNGQAYLWKHNTIQGFSASHVPSPWIGEYASFSLMPEVGTLKANNVLRGTIFSHADEIGMAHYYSVKLKNGIKVEMTPTSHACLMRIIYPANAKAHLLFDTKQDEQTTGSVQVDTAARVISGKVLNINNGWFQNVPTNHFYIQIDKKITSFGYPTGAGVCANVSFSTTANDTVLVRIGSSYLSVDQAQANLNAEIGDKNFETLKEEGAAEWDEQLGKIEIEGATEDQKTIFYSCMYRAYAYPNAMWEMVNGAPKYYSPYDGKVHDGKIYVNNGFWDTYKTAWPLYGILTPTLAGEMLDGFVTPFKQGRGVPRWSGPGILGAMVSSHSDVIFADAYVKGIRNFDYETAYQTMLNNSSTFIDLAVTGRTKNDQSVFNSYIPHDVQAESVSWTLENNICDAAISRMALAMGKTEDYEYFTNKSLGYTNLFSNSVGKFFRGKMSNGSWRTTDDKYLPNEWGNEYCEGNAWHYRFALVFDGQGMANLFGGTKQMETGIDEVFAADRSYLVGSYGYAIHEMKECYDTNMGQYNHTNANDHSLIYMYNYAGAPAKTAYWARQVMDRLYNTGAGNGGGYCGDEDNGSMSAWYIMSSSGIFAASGGVPEYLIGSPLFTKITYHLENGKDFVVSAPNNSSSNIYVQSATLNGVNLTKNFITHDDIKNGGTLVLDMGSAPSTWGTAEADLPSSQTKGYRIPVQKQDVTQTGTYSAIGQMSTNEGFINAFDNNSRTKWVHNNRMAWLQCQLPKPAIIDMYTITSANDNNKRDPKSWTLQGSNDGVNWTDIDTRTNETFSWRYYTRHFCFKNTTPFSYYRLNITEINGATMTQLAEFELFETNATLVQNNWRFRNDDGSETTATWMADERTQPNITDGSKTLRLRMRLDARSQSDGTIFNNLRYSKINYGSHFDVRQGKWTDITYDSGDSAFVLVSSQYLTPEDATSKQLSGFVGSTSEKAVSDTLHFAPSAVFVPGVAPKRISPSEYTEVEFCFRAGKAIQSDATYNFWLNGTDVNIEDGVTLPSVHYGNVMSLNAVSTNKNITIFPNPVVNQATVKFGQPCDNTNLEIHDAMGTLIKTVSVKDGATSMILNTSDLGHGVYFLNIQGKSQSAALKMIK